jgi:hypothetical protein
MLCKAHLHKFYAHGDPAVGRRKTDSGWGEGHTCGTHGYRFISDRGARREHIVVAEKALGRPLPPEAIVHHVDEDRANNANSNLVVCPDRAYHNLLHQRMRARDACGNPSWRKCCRCGQYDDPANMGISGSQAYHRECNAAHVRRINQEKRHG